MKNKILTATLIGMLFSLAAFAIPHDSLVGQYHEEVVSVGDVYIPSGFDSGSDAFIVVNGVFNNSCYDWQRAEVKNVNQMEHEIKVIARVRDGLCLMVLQPYTKEIRLGTLRAGVHKIKFNNGDGTYFVKKLEVE